MGNTLDTGRDGEEKAVRWLQKREYEIIDRNWRHGHLEIDIIARCSRYLHFIEVKTRNNRQFGYPEDEVGKTKLRHMIEAGVAWLALHPGWKHVRFDILAITLHDAEADEFFLIEDVYF